VLPYPLTSFNGRFPRNNEPVRFAENPGGCGSLLLLPIPSEISPTFEGVFARSLRVGTIKRSNLKEWHELSKFRYNEGTTGIEGCQRVVPTKPVEVEIGVDRISGGAGFLPST